MADLERLLAIVDEQLGVLAQAALEYPEHAELADEWIVDDLEDIGDHVGLWIGREHDFLRLAAAALDEHGRVSLERTGEQLFRQVEQFLHPSASARGHEADRHQVSFAQALFESIVQFLSGQTRFALFEIAAHDVFVDLDHLVDDALVRNGDVLDVALANRIEKAIDHLGPVARRQVDRQALRAEAAAQLFDQRAQLGRLRVDPVHHDDPAQVARLGGFHHASGAVLDALARVDHDADRFHR